MADISSPSLSKESISHLLEIISVLHLLRQINTVRGIRGHRVEGTNRGRKEAPQSSLQPAQHLFTFTSADKMQQTTQNPPKDSNLPSIHNHTFICSND